MLVAPMTTTFSRACLAWAVKLLLTEQYLPQEKQSLLEQLWLMELSLVVQQQEQWKAQPQQEKTLITLQLQMAHLKQKLKHGLNKI